MEIGERKGTSFQDARVERPDLKSTESRQRFLDQAAVPTLDIPREDNSSSGQLFVDF